MAAFAYASGERSFARSTVLVLAIAGTAYVAGALFHIPTSSHDGSAAFSQPVQAAEPNFGNRMRTANIVPPASTVDWGRTDGDSISQPRECDVRNGISSACLFMD